MTDLITAEEAEKLLEECDSDTCLTCEYARTVIALHAQLADAEAAQAAVVERAEKAEAERDAAIRGDIEDVRLVRFANGQFDFSGGPVKYISEYFAQMFEKGKGEYFNNMEIVFNHPKAGEMVLSAQRKRGLTPNEQRKTAEAERDALAAANAVLEAKVAGLRDFVDDFAKAKIDALRYSPPYGSSPEDEPDPVVDAKTVWAWQADAKAAIAEHEGTKK